MELTPIPSLVASTPPSRRSTGSGSKSKALVEFKTPADPPQKKRKVLEEDKFVEKLEKIIQRDFFPDLEKLKAQNAYHNAVENNDIHMLRELYSKYSLGATPRLLERSGKVTPSSFETPTPGGLKMGGGSGEVGEVKGTPTHLPMAPRPEQDDDAVSTVSSKSRSSSKDPTESMALNTFLANYTSEDNQSFEEIQEIAAKKHQIKYSWLYEKEKEHQEKFLTSGAVPSIEAQANQLEKPKAIDTWTYKNMNPVMYVPEGAPLTADEQVQLAKKVPQVNYNSTRFKSAPFKDGETSSSSSTSSTPSIFKKPGTKIGVDGKEIETDTPKVNGFSFVRTPSPTPGVEESPFLTWGEIEGTPFRLDGSDTPIPVDSSSKPYRMLETTKREKIAMQLQEKVSERYRDRKLKAMETAKHNLATPRPKSSIDRLSAMSPAARKLVGGHFGSSRDRSLAASYTPTMKQATPQVVTPSPIRKTFGSTPTPTPPRPSSSSTSSLGLGVKKKAADFF